MQQCKPTARAEKKLYSLPSILLCWLCTHFVTENSVFLASIMFSFIFLLNFNMHQMPLFLIQLRFFFYSLYPIFLCCAVVVFVRLPLCCVVRSALFQLRRAHGKAKSKRSGNGNSGRSQLQGRGGKRQNSEKTDQQKNLCIFMLWEFVSFKVLPTNTDESTWPSTSQTMCNVKYIERERKNRARSQREASEGKDGAGNGGNELKAHVKSENATIYMHDVYILHLYDINASSHQSHDATHIRCLQRQCISYVLLRCVCLIRI